MLKWLILLASIVALLDPFLLYTIYKHTGDWVFVVYVAPILIGNMFAARMRARAAAGQVDPLTGMAEAFLSPVARAMLWYPGPLTSFCGLLLLFPFTRRFALKLAMRRVTAAFSAQPGQGAMWSFGGQSGFPFGGGAGMTGIGGMNDMSSGGGRTQGSSVPPGNLKRTDARVVEDEEPPERPLLPE